jgi:hypothetical protein
MGAFDDDGLLALFFLLKNDSDKAENGQHG